MNTEDKIEFNSFNFQEWKKFLLTITEPVIMEVIYAAAKLANRNCDIQFNHLLDVDVFDPFSDTSMFLYKVFKENLNYDLSLFLCKQTAEDFMSSLCEGTEITVNNNYPTLPESSRLNRIGITREESKSLKDGNPKDAIGVLKSPMAHIPKLVLQYQGLAHLEGALKYGSHNWREKGVRASVYFDAVQRHLNQWYEGEDTDSDSNLPHIIKAIAGLNILADAILQNYLTDDRATSVIDKNWMKECNTKAENIINKYKK